MADTPVTGFKLKPLIRERLEEMSRYVDAPMTHVMNTAINTFYTEHFEPMRKDAERRAHRAAALARRLKDLQLDLPDGSIKNVGFVDGDQVVLHVGDVRWFESDQGELVASRVRGGRVEFGHPEKGGELVWTAVPLGDAAMN